MRAEGELERKKKNKEIYNLSMNKCNTDSEKQWRAVPLCACHFRSGKNVEHDPRNFLSFCTLPCRSSLRFLFILFILCCKGDIHDLLIWQPLQKDTAPQVDVVVVVFALDAE